MDALEELSGLILRNLLSDFEKRGLAVIDLANGYVGLQLSDFKNSCCSEINAPAVDFDLVLADLEKDKLVDTGPYVPYDNDRSSGVFVIGSFSKREFCYLTELGYKKARKNRSTVRSSPNAGHLHISGGHFHQSPIGIGGSVTQGIYAAADAAVFQDLRHAVSQISDESLRTKLDTAIVAMQKAPDSPTFSTRYIQFIGLAADAMTIITPFLPALSALLK